MDKIEIGGNSLLLRLGNYLTKLGTKYITKGNKLVITNPTCKLHSPWLMVVNFTVNGVDKYTITLQGKYKDKYKEKGNTENPISNEEMFMIIRGKKNQWFKKD